MKSIFLKKTFFFLSLITIFSGCDCGRKITLQEIQSLRIQAQEYLQQKQYQSAEKLFVEILQNEQTFSENESSIAKDKSTFAEIQSFVGKISPAIENYEFALEYYRKTFDKKNEIQILNSLGGLCLALKDNERAKSYFADALTISEVYGDSFSTIQSTNNYAMMLYQNGEYQKALSYFFRVKDFYQNHSLENTAKAIFSIADIYTKINNETEAIRIFTEAKNTLQLLNNDFVQSEFHFHYGNSLAYFEHWSQALYHYKQALQIFQKKSLDNEQKKRVVDIQKNIGNIFYKNFNFELAKSHFIEAYTLAKSINDKLSTGYLLVLIADCELKNGLPKFSQQSTINAKNYYEQSLTFFSRIGFIPGQSVALWKLGFLQELSRDVDGAIQSYKKALELQSSLLQDFSTNDNVFDELQQIPYTNLIELLLQQNKISEALYYAEQERTLPLWRTLQKFSFTFNNEKKQYLVHSYQKQFRESAIMERELLLQTISLYTDTQYRNEVEQKNLQNEKNLLTTSSTLAREYPAVEIYAKIPSFTDEEIQASLPENTTILNYYQTKNTLYIFVINPAQKISVIKKDVQKNGGYNYWISSVENLFQKRVVIIPPKDIPFFSMHSLQKNEKETLLDKVDVSYLPYLSCVRSINNTSRFVNSVSAFGNPTGKQWAVDFELRDIRSFFKDASINAGKNFTKQRLLSSTGDLLQLSTTFQQEEDITSSALKISAGNTTDDSEKMFLSEYTQLNSFSAVYFSSQENEENRISIFHAIIPMLNDACYVIATPFSSTTKANKIFSEKFYSTLASGGTVNEAYREAVLEIKNRKEFSQQWFQFFKFGK